MGTIHSVDTCCNESRLVFIQRMVWSGSLTSDKKRLHALNQMFEYTLTQFCNDCFKGRWSMMDFLSKNYPVKLFFMDGK